MNANDIILPLIKEIVKNEVKKQVKEEITRLVKAGILSVKSTKPQISENVVTKASPKMAKPAVKPTVKPKVVYTKNPMLNEILNSTQRFTKEERADGSQYAGGNAVSVLDSIKPKRVVTDDGEEWGEMRATTDNMPTSQPSMMSEEPFEEPKTDTERQQNTISKALNRDYRELVKRFK